MSKTKLSGFTPVPDALAKDLGLINAAVWGRVYRFADQSGVCTASHQRIGEDIGLHQDTVWKAINALVAHGYLEDLTPQAKGVTHTYKIGHDLEFVIGLQPADIIRGYKPPTDENGRGLLTKPAGVTDETGTKIQEDTSKYTLLAPTSVGALLLFEKANEEHRALGRRGVIKRFKSTKVKAKFDEQEARLGPKLERAIDDAITQGIVDVTSIVNYIAKWTGNGPVSPNAAKPRPGKNGREIYEQIMAERMAD